LTSNIFGRGFDSRRLHQYLVYYQCFTGIKIIRTITVQRFLGEAGSSSLSLQRRIQAPLQILESRVRTQGICQRVFEVEIEIALIVSLSSHRIAWSFWFNPTQTRQTNQG
jgi:hypothetical protein